MSIAVVIPAYNAARFIRQTLESVLSQSLPPDEVLVIDDGSTDDTARVAEEFGPAVRVIRRPNSMQSATRNFGVMQANTEWVAFVDADDLWEPNKLELQMRQLHRRPEADLCYCGLVEFYAVNGTVQIGRVAVAPSEEDVRQALHRNTSFLPSSVIVRRSTFLRCGGFNEAMNYVEDWELWLRMLHSGVQFTGCPEPLLRYRIHNGSMSHNAKSCLAAQKEVFRRHVFPYLPKGTRWISLMKSQSGQEQVAALVLRRAGQPGYLRMVITSIIRFPFNKPMRYKVLAHMFYTEAKRIIKLR